MLGLIPAQFLALTLVVCHPVPDGLVFRGIQVVVRSDKIEIRYQVGLSDAMIRRELGDATPEVVTSEMGGAEALARYRDLMFPQLPKRLEVTIEGRPVQLVPRRADIVRQPHAQLEFVYEIAFRPTSEPLRFHLLDENYSGVPGYHLSAMRGRGTVQVVPAGSQEIFARLPNIPEMADVEATPLQSVRKIEAFVRSTLPASDPLAREPGSHPESAEPATDSEAAPSDATATNRAGLPIGEPVTTPDASPLSIDLQTPRMQREQAVASDIGRIIWCVGFGGLAVLIALAWLCSSRKGNGR